MKPATHARAASTAPSASHLQDQQFTSDNFAGICPEAMAALCDANAGHAPAYGRDTYTLEASDALRKVFGSHCEVFFVFNGTAANSLALAALCHSYNSVICSSAAHVETDECGAPEFFSNGAKLLLAQSPDGKLTPRAIRELATSRSDIHFPRPSAVTITQPTELGTLYTPDEIAAISRTCKDLGLYLHMDGARFANACASLDAAPAQLSWKAGVDVLCLGGTKNGMGLSEAIVFFNQQAARDFAYRCKQAGQLASKMRFLAAPWTVMLETGAWLDNARHANACARRLERRIRGLEGVKILFAVQSNAVFVKAAPALLDALRQRGWKFYTFIGGGARFMFAWDADPARVDALANDLCELARE